MHALSFHGLGWVHCASQAYFFQELLQAEVTLQFVLENSKIQVKQWNETIILTAYYYKWGWLASNRIKTLDGVSKEMVCCLHLLEEETSHFMRPLALLSKCNGTFRGGTCQL